MLVEVVLVGAKAPCLTKADAVIPTIHHDGRIQVLCMQLQFLTQQRDLLGSLLLALLSIRNPLRH
ncbi:hypothetical protein D3C84_1122320 [compost metagenome]